MHLYVPEIDPVTEEGRDDRADHNHFFHRPKPNLEAFNDALQNPESDVTYAALIRKRKQSLKDAERLLPTIYLLSIL